MKINTEKRAVSTDNLTDENEVRNFTIKADAAMFKMLSSTLYTHKVRAVIRELVCNAWDAHQSAKRYDTPIKVHLPTHMEPYFEVKDFGKGLSHENVMKLFSTYGESTKQGSNKEIGGFGIGSKSPFCYVDSFLVESRFNGVKSSYNAFIEKTGAPSIVLMGQNPMEEGELPGITVKMNAATKDINEFNNEALRVLRTFASPSVEVNTSRQLEPFHVFYRNEHGSLLDKDKESIHGMFALMGNVIYPIPESSYQDAKHLISGTLRNAFTFLHSRAYVFNFNIGELEVAPSREQLSLTSDSIKNIQKRIIGFMDAFLIERKEKLSVHRHPWQFLNASREMSNILDIDMLPFRGAKVKLFSEKNTPDEIRRRLNSMKDRYNAANLILEIVPTLHPDCDSSTSSGNTLKLDKRLTAKGNSILPYTVEKGKLTWVWHSVNAQSMPSQYNTPKPELNPLPKIILMHGTKECLDSDSVKYKYFLKRQAMDNTRVYTIKIPYTDPLYLRTLKRKLLHIPDSCYVWFKDLPVPTEEELKAVGIKTDSVAANKELGKPREYVVYDVRVKLGKLYTGTHNRVVKPTDLPDYKSLGTGEVLYYMNLDDWKAAYTATTVNEIQGESILFNHWDDLATKPRILGLCKTHCEEVEDNSKWVNAAELFKGYFMDILTKRFHYPVKWTKDKVKVSCYGNERGMRFERQQFKSQHPDFVRFMKIMDRVQASTQRYVVDEAFEAVVEYAKKFGLVIPQNVLDKPVKNSQDDDKFLNEFFTKYPMIRIPSEVSDENSALFEDYITTINTIITKRKKRK